MDTRLRHGLWIITSIMCGYVWLYFIHIRPCSRLPPLAATNVCRRGIIACKR